MRADFANRCQKGGSMKTLKTLAIAVLALGACSVSRAGLLDLRFGIGLSAANPKGFEDRVNNLSGTDLSAGSFDTYNGDVVLRLPVVPVTVGLRYEDATQKQSA